MKRNVNGLSSPRRVYLVYNTSGKVFGIFSSRVKCEDFTSHLRRHGVSFFVRRVELNSRIPFSLCSFG